MKCEIAVIGSGLTGATVARQLANAGYSVLVLEKRNHIGGNLYDFREPNGFLVQRYGPHVFHTSDRKLVDYILQYDEWVPYAIKCGAVINGVETPTPFNFQTIDQFYDTKSAFKLKNRFQKMFPGRKTISVLEALNCRDEAIQSYARFLFENDYLPYTAKQWGIPPKEIDASVLNRVPLCLSYDDSYFNEEYEMLPKNSFTHFISNLLNHEKIKVILNSNGLDRLSFAPQNILFDGKTIPVVFTGPIDSLFKYRFGELPYRSLRFEFLHASETGIQGRPVIAYPQVNDFTRITDFRHLPEQPGFSQTTYAVEYPVQFGRGCSSEPYYPVLTEASRLRYLRYKQLTLEYHNLFCCGRLAEFKYYNMDQALRRALETANELLAYLNNKPQS